MSHDNATETAADLAAVAALLEIVEALGVSPILDRSTPFTLDDLATAASVPEKGIAGLLEALLASGLVERTDHRDQFRPCPDLADRRYESGYLSWALNANRPFIENAHEFLSDPDGAARKYQRDGRRVAISSRWVGSQGFYPGARSAIIDNQPERIVDLGAGAAGLLIDVLRTLPDSSGVALDMSTPACEEAARAADRAGVGDRLEVVNRTIESLVDDPTPVHGANAVHAGFVMHDVAADLDTFDAILRSCRASMAPAARLIVTDGVPYAANPRERTFSALFTYLHAGFMGVRLPTEEQWQAAFHSAGFSEVSCHRLRFPTGRLFVASG